MFGGIFVLSEQMFGLLFFICRWVVGVGGRLPHFSALTRESATQKRKEPFGS